MGLNKPICDQHISCECLHKEKKQTPVFVLCVPWAKNVQPLRSNKLNFSTREPTGCKLLFTMHELHRITQQSTMLYHTTGAGPLLWTYGRANPRQSWKCVRFWERCGWTFIQTLQPHPHLACCKGATMKPTRATANWGGQSHTHIRWWLQTLSG